MDYVCKRCYQEELELVDVIVTGFAERCNEVQKLTMKAQYVCKYCGSEYSADVTGTVDWGTESE